MACLENKKVVVHDGTDESNPMFDVYQDIQLQNDYATMQLTVMGYLGDVLKAVFSPDKIRQRRAEETVTVKLTHEQQVALAAAKTCGKIFFATGGDQHLTADDGFIAAEMCFREAAVKEKEKEKKSRMEGNAKRDATLIVLDRLENHLDGNVGALLSKELETLLKRKGVQVSKMGDKAAKRALYKKFLEEGGGSRQLVRGRTPTRKSSRR